MAKSLKIVSLVAENFQRLRAVAIHPDGSPIVRLAGRNAQGKTSVLESIAATLGGERLCPAVPIRRGEDHAEVTVDLGDVIVTRRWTAGGGSALWVKSREGARFPSPQS